jgi:raffinose/stachyose/melibiose transport system permease protein
MRKMRLLKQNMELSTSPQLRVGNKPTIFMIYLVLILASVVVMLPLLWLLSSSLKTQADLSVNIWGLPRTFHFENYVRAWQGSKLDRYMTNSIYVTLLSIAITIIACTPVAFVLARFKFRINRVLYYFVIAGMMVPIHSAIIPIYMMAQDFKLQNSLAALSLIYGAFRIPVSVFILESFIATIPKEMEECAFIDGCSIWKLFIKIIMPLSKDGIVTIAILTVLATWNELLVAMLMLSKPEIKTLPIGLMGFINEFNSEYTQLAAGILIALIPSILFYIIAQERIERGMTAGSIKG